jgi:SAM dependent carboxyl methyltransferase
LAESDFSALFRTLSDDPDSYLRRDTAAFASAIGRSFYEQILPSASVTLAWSSWALQWLSRTPARISDQVHINASHDAAAIAVYADQAEQDWRAFLTSRGRELREGGRLVVLTMALRDGDFGLRPLVEAMYGALLDLVDEGFIHSDERKRMAIPMVSRSRDNLAAPFVENGHFAGLSMEHLEVFESEDRNWSEFGTDHDAEKFGAKWAAFSRGSVFPTLALSLEGGRHDPRAAKFVDKLEVGMATRLAAAPQPMCIPLARIALVKQDR